LALRPVDPALREGEELGRIRPVEVGMTGIRVLRCELWSSLHDASAIIFLSAFTAEFALFVCEANVFNVVFS